MDQMQAETVQTSSSEESPAQKQARIRRDRREAKIKAGGSARLEKITNLSGRPAEAGMFNINAADSSVTCTGALHLQRQ